VPEEPKTKTLTMTSSSISLNFQLSISSDPKQKILLKLSPVFSRKNLHFDHQALADRNWWQVEEDCLQSIEISSRFLD
jgi:hypothetical protein